MDMESENQSAKEEKALELLEKFDEITLTDDFNKSILARIQEEKPSSYHWYKPWAVIAASVLAIIVIWNFQKSPTDEHLIKVARGDIPVIENLDLLDKMEILEHLDVLVDTESTREFLQLLEKG